MIKPHQNPFAFPTMLPFQQLLFLGAVLCALSHCPGVSATVSPQCAQETKKLQADSFLSMVQDDLYNSYHADVDRLCDFSSFTKPECGLEFDGNNKTFVAACEDKGGQVLTRPVVFRCGYSVATFNMDLGYVPTCIAASCNASAVKPHEMNDTRVEQFLWDISVTGCDADLSGARSSLHRSMLTGLSFLVGGLTWLQRSDR